MVEDEEGNGAEFSLRSVVVCLGFSREAPSPKRENQKGMAGLEGLGGKTSRETRMRVKNAAPPGTDGDSCSFGACERGSGRKKIAANGNVFMEAGRPGGVNGARAATGRFGTGIPVSHSGMAAGTTAVASVRLTLRITVSVQ